ncbi:hypothetical protein GCM10009639_11500 [Kitasatospora putterlickiae]|uniref:FHA domain-containing protein n=1 Tax=Kitasatospora putterlickiae TaxID=221725 RepID=A0ABP4IGG4_9ACTN
MSPPSQDQALPRLIIDGPDRLRGQVYQLDDEPLLVGRDSTCGLQLAHPLLSRRHAVVWWAGGHTTVEDLDSTNGTRLNGHRVLGQRILRDGDVLRFGPLEVHYEEPADAVTAVAGPDTSAGDAARPTLRTAGPAPEPEHAVALAETAPREHSRPDQPPDPVWPGPAAPPKPPAEPAEPAEPAAAPMPWGLLSRLDIPTPKPALQGDDRRFDVDLRRAEENLGGIGGNQSDEAPRFVVDQQVAKENLNNVGRDQVNNFFQNDHLQLARRETFFQKIAAARTMARHLLVTGLVLAVLGGAFLGWEGSYPDTLTERIQGIAHSASVVLAVTGVVLLVGGGTLMIRTMLRQHRYEQDEERRLNPGPSPSG